jgi:aconitate hydratase
LRGIKPFGELLIEVKRSGGSLDKFPVKLRIDTELELRYWQSGGILNYVLSGFLK